MTDLQRRKLINEERTGRGFLNNRYVLIVAIIEVFFRKNMGVRYFTLPLFFAGFVGICLIRFWMVGAHYFELNRFDLFTGAYILFGVYNFYLQQRNARSGVIFHSWYTGDSQFAFVGKFFKAKYPTLFAYVYVEPLVILILVLPIATYSILLAIGAIVGAGQLWFQNYRLVRRFKNEELDRQDGRVVAEHVATTSFSEEVDDRASPPPLPRRAAVPPPIPLSSSDHEELSPLEVLERLNKEDQTNN